MKKILALFVVFFFVSVPIESNATTVDPLVWTLGSAVNVTLGPEDAVYCRLKNNMGTIVFDGFGPCRVVVDRVTRQHGGFWELYVGALGTVTVDRSWVTVEVVEDVDSTPVVTTDVVRNESVLILTCSVPQDYQVQSCSFRDPFNTIFIASPEVSQDRDDYQAISYESVAEENSCKLTVLQPVLERDNGIWRCAVQTTQGASYGFLSITSAMFNSTNYPTYNNVPTLESKFNGISGMEGDAVTMACSINAPVRYCYFRTPNGTVFNVGPSTSSADFEYVGNGFEAGECGIRFSNIWASAQGQWSCSVGLKNTSYFEEKRDSFYVYVDERMMVYHLWQGSTIEVRLRISFGPELEYCRFVRSDGLGFISNHVPMTDSYDVYQGFGSCTLYIKNPVAEDLRPWTVVAKVSGEDEERSVTTTLEPRPQSTYGLSRTASNLLWSLIVVILVFLFVATCLHKKKRQWTHQRVVRDLRQPQPQSQNVTVVPVPVHTDIFTDLPRKV